MSEPSERESDAIRVRVRFGGALARRVPAARTALTLPAGATVADLAERLTGEDPVLGEALGASLAFLAGAAVPQTHALADGDEVAFLPPAAGG